MVMSLDAYNKAYGYEEFASADNYSDLITALYRGYLSVKESFENNHYSKRNPEKFTNDYPKEFHATAEPNELLLDSYVDQFKSYVLTPEHKVLVETIYSKSLPDSWMDTSANRLENKLGNTVSIIRRFKKDLGLEFKYFIRYHNHRLYLGDGMHADFTAGSDQDILLNILLENSETEWNLMQLMDIFVHRKDESIASSEDELQVAKSIKRAKENINSKFKKATKAEDNVIKMEKNKIFINQQLIDPIKT